MPFPALADIPHDLDFEYPDFLHFRQLPPFGDWPLRGWMFFATIISNESFMRPMYRVRDAKGDELLVAFYLNNDNPRADEMRNFKVDHTMCFLNVQQHQFMDGQVGLRIEDEELDDLKVMTVILAVQL
jgi:hypothetical protein